MSDKLTKNYYETDYKTFLLSSPLESDDSDKLTKNYYETDYKTFLLSSPLASDDSDDPDYFVDSSQSQSSSQSSQSSSEVCPSPQKESSQ